MNNVTRALLASCLIAPIAPAVLADSQMIVAESFAEIYDVVTALGIETDLSDTLIVMDDDDTLTMMPCLDASDPLTCQYLGGPAWFQWQSDLLTKYQQTGATTPLPGQVETTDTRLFGISDLLLQLNFMTFADPSIPATVNQFVADGAELMVLTARDTSSSSATDRQMNNLSVGNGQNLAAHIKENAPNWVITGVPDMAGLNSSFCGAQTPVAYDAGILYATGQNKGEMLGCFLQGAEVTNITNIVFIDDTEENVQDIYNYFTNDQTSLEVLAIHFTQLSDHKATFLATGQSGGLNEYQSAATERWQEIRAVLSDALLEPTGLQ